MTQTPDTGTQGANGPTAAAHSDQDAAALAALAATVERARATAAELGALLAEPDQRVRSGILISDTRP